MKTTDIFSELKKEAVSQLFDTFDKARRERTLKPALDASNAVTAEAQAEMDEAVVRLLQNVLTDAAAAKQFPGIRAWLMASVKDLQETLICEELHSRQAKDPDFQILGEAA